jgi:hypothetical protein
MFVAINLWYRQGMPRTWILALCAISFSMLPSCAYRLQGAHNPLTELGIQKIYVSGFRNQTFRPGIEQLFTSAMVREISRARAFELVNSESDADAVLSGIVTTAESTPGSTKVYKVGTRDVDIAAEYNASVNCLISLHDRRQKLIFSQSVAGSKIHPGSAQVGDAGSTAPLVNDSGQRLAIQFLASQMMASVYQRMIDTF